MRYHASGLTLLEMIVVMMIAGMALALGFQSLGQWRRAEVAIAGVGSSIRQDALLESWFASSIQALTPIEEAAFKGSRTAVSGITLAPVLATQGGSTPISWSIESSGGAMQLMLSEHGIETPLPLPRSQSAHFIYLDSEGKAHEQWPPSLGIADALPASIALVMSESDAESSRVWMASVTGIRNPPEILPMYEPDSD